MDYTPKPEILNKYDRVVTGFQSGKTLDIEYRRQQLRNLYYAVKDNQEKLKQALFLDLHRAPEETEILELHLILSEIHLAITNLSKWAADQSLGMGDLRIVPAHPHLRKTPYGSVLIMSPWNYPLLCLIAPVASAIAAGNTVLIKPSEMVPNVSLVTAAIMEKALDPEIFQVVQGAVEEATLLLEQKWDKIMLTGSSNVGKIVATAAAKHLTPVALELGGKSPVIITSTADVKLAAQRIAWGKLCNSGQTCIAPDYVICDASLRPKFVEEYCKVVEQMYPNVGPDSKDYGHIVNERLWERLDKLVKSSNGKVELGGQGDRASHFYAPTVVSSVSLDDPLMTEELFGPILPIIDVKNALAEAPGIIRNHDYPLALYVFSNKPKDVESLLSQTRSGAVMVNDVMFQGASTEVPFGGVGTSGSGRYHGKFGFDEFTYERPVLEQPGYIEFAIAGRYAPYSDKKVDRMQQLGVPPAWFPREGPVGGPSMKGSMSSVKGLMNSSKGLLGSMLG